MKSFGLQTSTFYHFPPTLGRIIIFLSSASNTWNNSDHLSKVYLYVGIPPNPGDFYDITDPKLGCQNYHKGRWGDRVAINSNNSYFLAVNSSPERWSLMWDAVLQSSYGYMHNIAPPNTTITQIPTAAPSKNWVLQRGPLYS